MLCFVYLCFSRLELWWWWIPSWWRHVSSCWVPTNVKRRPFCSLTNIGYCSQPIYMSAIWLCSSSLCRTSCLWVSYERRSDSSWGNRWKDMIEGGTLAWGHRDKLQQRKNRSMSAKKSRPQIQIIIVFVQRYVTFDLVNIFRNGFFLHQEKLKGGIYWRIDHTTILEEINCVVHGSCWTCVTHPGMVFHMRNLISCADPHWTLVYKKVQSVQRLKTVKFHHERAMYVFFTILGEFQLFKHFEMTGFLVYNDAYDFKES